MEEIGPFVEIGRVEDHGQLVAPGLVVSPTNTQVVAYPSVFFRMQSSLFPQIWERI